MMARPNRHGIRVNNVTIIHKGGDRADLRIDLDVPNVSGLMSMESIEGLTNAVGTYLDLRMPSRFRQLIERLI